MGEYCAQHPDRPAEVQCMKMGSGYCSECLEECRACTDPSAYCKYRPQCVIWEECRQVVKQRKREASGGAA